jgi:hypothetical protein
MIFLTSKVAKVLLMFMAFSAVNANARPHVPNDADQAAKFVRSFYAWYLPAASAMKEEPAWRQILTARRSALDSNLAEALATDLAAQEKVDGEIVGLDFDPFLDSQDPCEHYYVRDVSQRAGTFLVRVISKCENTSSHASFVVIVRKKSERWVICNLDYGGGVDLLDVLSRLKANRKSD